MPSKSHPHFITATYVSLESLSLKDLPLTQKVRMALVRVTVKVFTTHLPKTIICISGLLRVNAKPYKSQVNLKYTLNDIKIYKLILEFV